MTYQIDYAYTCHMGKVRANNEDNFWCCGSSLPAENQGIEEVRTGSASHRSLPVLSVFDGMGGESCGEMAAGLAAQTFGSYYAGNRKELKRFPDNFIRQAVLRMNESVCSYARENRVGSMGTTMAMLMFGQKGLYVCNLGDSRIYESKEGGLRQISRDHVLGGNLFGKAPLTQYLGIPREYMDLEISADMLEYDPGCRYLICSDGMTDMLSDGEIADILSREISVEDTVKLLLERTLKKGGKDNITIVLAEITERRNRNPIRALVEEYRSSHNIPLN